MEPPDPHRVRRQVIRSFLGRHEGRNCTLPLCLKPGERGTDWSCELERKEGRVWGGKDWMAGEEGTGTGQHILKHPPGRVAQAASRAEQVVGEEQGLGT